MLLALEPDIFMFDEPTAGMSVDEVPVILELIHDIKNQKDKTILLVEHKMDVVRSLSDRIVVLHQGKLMADGKPADVPPLTPANAEEKERFEAAQQRRALRQEMEARHKAIKAAYGTPGTSDTVS